MENFYLQNFTINWNVKNLTNSTKYSIIKRNKNANNRKIIIKMNRQPNGIRFNELHRVLEHYGYNMKTKKGTSHRQFINSKGDVITIKEENPLKAVYVKDVLKRIGGSLNENAK